MNIELAQVLADNAVDLAREIDAKAQELQCTLRILGCEPKHIAMADRIVANAHSLEHYATGIVHDLDAPTEQEPDVAPAINHDEYRCQFMAGGQYVATCDNDAVMFTVLERRNYAPYQWEVSIAYATMTDVVPVAVSVSTFLCGRATECLELTYRGQTYSASSTSFFKFIG